jgi:hypothetical protein
VTSLIDVRADNIFRFNYPNRHPNIPISDLLHQHPVPSLTNRLLISFHLRAFHFIWARRESNACGRAHDPRVRRPMFYLPFVYALFVLRVRRESNACGRAHDPRMKRPVFYIYFRLRAFCFTSASGIQRVWTFARSSRETTDVLPSFPLRTLRFTSASGVERVWTCARSSREMTGFFFISFTHSSFYQCVGSQTRVDVRTILA